MTKSSVSQTSKMKGIGFFVLGILTIILVVYQITNTSHQDSMNCPLESDIRRQVPITGLDSDSVVVQTLGPCELTVDRRGLSPKTHTVIEDEYLLDYRDGKLKTTPILHIRSNDTTWTVVNGEWKK
jgi:hypothetical protein